VASTVAAALGLRADAAERTTVLSADAVLHTTGSAAFRMDVRDGFEVDPMRPGFSLRYDGSWAAFMVIRRARPGSRDQPLMLGLLEEPAPAGCAAGQRGAGCANGRGLRLPTYWPDSVSYGGTALNPYGGAVYHYPPGRYEVYLLTDPGRHVTVRWRTGQSRKGVTLTPPRRSIRTNYRHSAVSGNGLVAMTSGTVQQRLTRTGMLFDFMWAANRPGTQFEVDQAQLCVMRGEGRPGVEGASGETCAVADATAQPGYLGGNGGEGSSTYGFAAVGRTFVEVRPGMFAVPHSIRMTGHDPQVGTSMLAAEYLR
jgi:hypothetical protein